MNRRNKGNKKEMEDALPIEGRDIIFVGSADWDTKAKTSTHHMAFQLSKCNRILYIDSIGQRTPQATARHFSRIVSRISRFLKGPTAISDSITRYSPIAIPLHRYRAVRAFNKKLVTASISLVSRRLGFQNPILIVFPPQMFFLPGKLNESVSAYYCTDNHSAFPGADRASILEMEKELVEKTNMSFVTAEKLAEGKRSITPNVFYIPHGLDFDHFAFPKKDGEPLFKKMAGVKKPVIGFFGSISEWVDQGIVAHAARLRPDWSFVFAGEIRVDVSSLRNLKNVFFTGFLDYDELPSIGKSFDVSVIPFTEDDITVNVNPIKLREYLALGAPVVSTPMPEVEKFKGLVYVASGPEQFLERLDQALEEDSPEKRAARKEAVRGDSWHFRAKAVCERLKEFLEK